MILEHIKHTLEHIKHIFNTLNLRDFESKKGFLTDVIAKFAKNQIQKSLLAYFAAIGGFEFFNRE